MKYQNKMSKKFITKFMNDTHDITDRGWFSTFFWYTISSKERIRKRLDLFLKEQLDGPNLILVDLSKQFLKYRNPDERIIKILKFVYDNVKYVTDERNFGMVEKWAVAITTWAKKKDDCDGINALIYILARLAAISDLNLWSVIGDTAIEGHYWLEYLSPKTGQWYAIDGTAWPSFQSIKTRPPFRLSEKKYIKRWFKFNEQYIGKQR